MAKKRHMPIAIDLIISALEPEEMKKSKNMFKKHRPRDKQALGGIFAVNFNAGLLTSVKIWWKIVTV